MRLILVGVILGASTVQAEWWSWIPKTVSTVKDGYNTVKGWFGGNSDQENQNSDTNSEGSDGATSSQPSSKNTIGIKNEANPKFEQNFNQPINLNLGSLKSETPKSDTPTAANAPHSVTQPQGIPIYFSPHPGYGYHHNPAYYSHPHYGMPPQNHPQYRGHPQPNLSPIHPNGHLYNGGYNSHPHGSFGSHPNTGAYHPSTFNAYH